MTAVLAAAARAAAGTVLVLAAAAAAFWAGTGPLDLHEMPRLLVMSGVWAAATWGLSALAPRRGPPPLTGAQLEAARRLAAETLADGHLAIERSAWQAVPRHLKEDDDG